MPRKKQQKSTDSDFVEYSQPKPSKSAHAPTLGPHPPFDPLQLPPPYPGKAINIPPTVKHAVDVFRLFFDDIAIDLLVRATNQNAERSRAAQELALQAKFPGVQKRQRPWRNVISNEMLVFLGLYGPVWVVS